MKRTIVIVDDEPITRMDTREILEANGYDVVGEASDGFEAIEVCKKYNPSLVLMDIDMPLLDGIKASKVLTKEKLVGGVILLTAFEDKKYIEMAKEVGAFGYMIKPVNEKVFIPTVEICLSKAEEFDELKKDYDKINNKLNDRKLIEKAKGILVKQLNSNENDAYNRIRKLSMDRRTTMAEIAKIIIVGYEG
ncbi:ANTAR domain-containing response regulator [Clostridium perfringens]|uniref:ANTAR domain-containing response regulator n=1 Tax=Clostridium perfringens TaxID=1502 RepID=UPI000B3AF738|nr:response regulator [Clostridium perfringens]EHK2401039.1 response regulator [Clostridium perfringens]MDK0785469.1 response regulator [Clostridium perfringens]MDK0847160.1 response regulator [Clostridium perfringens]MDK3121267.1 response regulator [Clostridium perfringens]MDM0793222.1 response regulator [Clostridium perfringens]